MMWWLVSLALAAPVTPDEVVGLALARHPDLAAAEAAVEEARGERAASSWLRENPQVEARVSLDGEKVEVAATQALSLSGEGLADARAARYGLQAAEATRTREQFVVAAEARRLYVDVVLADIEVGIALRRLAITTRLREAAEARLAAGDAPPLDARLARLDQAAAAGTLIEAEAHAADAHTVLSAVTGLPPDVELDADPLVAAPQPTGLGGDRSDVRAAEASVEAAAAALARERAAMVPSFELGAFVDDGFFGPAVGIEVPIWHRNDAGRGLARGGALRAESEREATVARARAEQARAPGLLAVATRAVELLAGDVPTDAATALDDVERAYVAGEMGMAEVGLLQTRVIEGQRGWYAARAAAAEARIGVLLATEDPVLLGPVSP